MKIYLDWIDDDDPDGDLMTVDWPDSFRVPMAGETLLVGIGTWRVLDVQWEVEQGQDRSSAVTLRVAASSEVSS